MFKHRGILCIIIYIYIFISDVNNLNRMTVGKKRECFATKLRFDFNLIYVPVENGQISTASVLSKNSNDNFLSY